MTFAIARGLQLKWILRIAVLIGIVGIAAWQISSYVSVRAHFNRGKEALEHDDPATALQHFNRYLEWRPESAEGHFLAAQAARRSGDLAWARQHLDEAIRLGWTPQAIEVEGAILEAQSGHLPQVVHILVWAVSENHPDTADILPILVPAYLADFRLLEAAAFSTRWIELRPQAAKAWALHADILERLRKKDEAINALRTLVKLTPDDREARLNLARLIIEAHQPADEAAEHLEWLVASDPKNPAVLTQLAACREAQGRPQDAISLLDKLLADTPRNAQALHIRGRLEMNEGRPAIAVQYLQRGVEVDPSDRELLYSLFHCLQKVGTPEEVRAAEERWKRCEADLRKVSELGKAIAASPRDPELRREIGEIFLRNGRERDGIRWLESSLRIDPSHPSTHAVLADHYARTGRLQLAELHRSLSRQSLKPAFP